VVVEDLDDVPPGRQRIVRPGNDYDVDVSETALQLRIRK
jgi:hypothetical protein